MASKRKSPKQLPASNSSTNNPTHRDHLAAGAADLRGRAAACRIARLGRSCDRLDAAATLLDPGAEDAPLSEAAEVAEEATEAPPRPSRAPRNKAQPKAPRGATVEPSRRDRDPEADEDDQVEAGFDPDES